MQSDTEIQNEAPPIESVAPTNEGLTSSPTGAGESKGESKETLLDAVLEVVKPTREDGEESDAADKEEAPASEDAEGEGQAEQDETKEGTEEEASEDEEDKAPQEASPQARKKINKLLRQRRELRNELSTLKPDAEIGTQLQSFAQTHDLSSDDVINALHIAATLRRGDMQTFYGMMSPYIRHAQEYLGIVLPQDLQQMVEQQQMTPAAAREFAKTRFDHQRVQTENQRMNEMGRQYAVQEAQGSVQRAVSNFESQLMASDPDYKGKKAGFVQREAKAILDEQFGGQVQSVEQALTIVRTAYDNVNSQLRKLAPPPKATARTPGATNSQTPSSRPAPKSLMEAVMAGLHSNGAR